MRLLRNLPNATARSWNPALSGSPETVEVTVAVPVQGPWECWAGECDARAGAEYLEEDAERRTRDGERGGAEFCGLPIWRSWKLGRTQPPNLLSPENPPAPESAAGSCHPILSHPSTPAPQRLPTPPPLCNIA